MDTDDHADATNIEAALAKPFLSLRQTLRLRDRWYLQWFHVLQAWKLDAGHAESHVFCLYHPGHPTNHCQRRCPQILREHDAVASPRATITYLRVVRVYDCPSGLRSPECNCGFCHLLPAMVFSVRLTKGFLDCRLYFPDVNALLPLHG